jgi:hypothetical protein
MRRITSSLIGAIEELDEVGEGGDVTEFVLAEFVVTVLLFLLCSVVVQANETETITAREQRMRLFFIRRISLNLFFIAVTRKGITTASSGSKQN